MNPRNDTVIYSFLKLQKKCYTNFILGIIAFLPSILLLIIKYVFKIDENTIDVFIRLLTLAHIFFSGLFISNISQSYIFKSPVLLRGEIKRKLIIRILVFIYSILISLLAFYFWEYSIALISPMEWPSIDELRLAALLLLFLVNLSYKIKIEDDEIQSQFCPKCNTLCTASLIENRTWGEHSFDEHKESHFYCENCGHKWTFYGPDLPSPPPY